MPAARRDLDPMTGDYVLSAGGPRADDGRTSKVVLRLRKRRGSGLFPKLGSRLYTITKNEAGATRLAEHYAYEAVADLVALGEIRSVTAKATPLTENGTTSLMIDVSFVDTDGDRRVAKYQRSFGGS